MRTRVARVVGKWLTRRLQRKLEREWRDYQRSDVTVGPFVRHRGSEAEVYRSLIQIHFHNHRR